MLCNVTQMPHMSRGNSGRIVIEVDPAIKQSLYGALQDHGYGNLKEWFLEKTRELLDDGQQQIEIPFPDPIDPEKESGK